MNIGSVNSVVVELQINMCGLTGFLGGNWAGGVHAKRAQLTRMTDAIVHRGPDSDGVWLDGDARMALGHRRLAILDLSEAGAQPMVSTDKTFVIAFNGEIYNHLAIRRELEARDSSLTWRGTSDTETLLAGFMAWGIQATLERAVGMFAIAVWDRLFRTLILATDRMGEKPLYYGWQGHGYAKTFLFGSELKALRVHSSFENHINPGALALQLRHNCIPAPHSIYKGVSKLPPGCMLQVSLDRSDYHVWRYWTAEKAARSGVAKPFVGTTTEAVDKLEIVLKDAVRQQMVADVPLGAFLSGGVDSSTVVALMQAQSARPVKTFTIGFHTKGYNEAEHAKAIAKHLGCDHTELYVTPDDAMAVIPRLPTLYDEPFSDSSQIPTFLISQLARQHVKVALSGDAGDELFCGYNRYRYTARFWPAVSALPLPWRTWLGHRLMRISPESWNALAKAVPGIGDRIHKSARVLASPSTDALYRNLVSHWNDPASVVIAANEPSTLLTFNVPDLAGLDAVQRMMALDMLTYLPDDILVKVDRAAMGVGLETRVPFLDHGVVEFAWQLPQTMKYRQGQTKWALRQVLYRHVPQALIDRPKMGFAVPIGEWLRGPLRDWAESLLNESRLRQEGFFHAPAIRQKWEEHIAGNHHWQDQLWDVLMFQAWVESR